jgi:hypothetical protein
VIQQNPKQDINNRICRLDARLTDPFGLLTPLHLPRSGSDGPCRAREGSLGTVRQVEACDRQGTRGGGCADSCSITGGLRRLFCTTKTGGGLVPERDEPGVVKPRSS